MPAYKEKSRATWYVKFRHKDWQGNIKNITKRGFATKRDAVAWERDYLLKQTGNVSMAFKCFAERYKEEVYPRLKRSTQVTKDNIIDHWIIPFFGEMKLNEIQSIDVIHWQNTFLKQVDAQGDKKFTSSYLKTVHNQLSTIFNYAIRNYGLIANPATIAGNMGSSKEVTMSFWTQDEYMRFAEEAKENPLAYYCFEVLYWCGIREGELLALTWEDIDLTGMKLSITKTFQHLDGKDMITPPKTPKSRRIVSMPTFLCDELKAYKEEFHVSDDTARAFPVTKSFLSRNLKKFALKQGLKPICVHELRHSHVSLLINMGFNPVAIAERVGHKSIDITYRYAHLFPSVQTQMCQMLNAAKEGENENVCKNA